MTRRPFVKGDCVVITCDQADQFLGKVWVCESNQFTGSGQEQVVQLIGYTGYLPVKQLALVNGDLQKENELLRQTLGYVQSEICFGAHMDRYWAREAVFNDISLALEGKWDSIGYILENKSRVEQTPTYPVPNTIPWARYSNANLRIIGNEDHLVTNGIHTVIAQHVRLPTLTGYGWMANCVRLEGITHFAVINEPSNQ